MMSPETIAYLSRQVAIKAFAYKLEPYHPDSIEEVRGWKSFPFPNLGDYRPAGWTLADTVMADSTGWGLECKPALTVPGLKRWCADILAEDPTAAFGIVESGEFQVIVGYFTEEGSEAADALELEPDDHVEFDFEFCPACDEPIETGREECPWCRYDLVGEEEDEDRDEDEEDEFIREGIDAYQDGQPLDSNPYPCPSLEHEAWNLGWNGGKMQEVERMKVEGQPSLGL